MKPMFQRVSQLLFVVVLCISFIEISSAYSVGTSTCHSEVQEVVKHDHEGAADQESHCPFEAIHHCCHVNIVLLTSTLPVTENLVSQNYSEFSEVIKPFPDVDGPFQPPRT